MEGPNYLLSCEFRADNALQHWSLGPKCRMSWIWEFRLQWWLNLFNQRRLWSLRFSRTGQYGQDSPICAYCSDVLYDNALFVSEKSPHGQYPMCGTLLFLCHWLTRIPLSYLLLSFPKNKFVCDYPIPVKSTFPFYPWEWTPLTSEPFYLNLG